MATVDKLSSARLKIERANEHVKNLVETVLNPFTASNPCRFSSKLDPETGCYIHRLEELTPVPPRIGLLAGEVIYHLRSALDHTAFQLWLAGISDGIKSVPEASVAFPIFDGAAKYNAEKTGKIKGFRPDAIKAVDAIQPYKGGKGHILWVINELNRVEKHRLPLVVVCCMARIKTRPLDDATCLNLFGVTQRKWPIPIALSATYLDGIVLSNVGDEWITDPAQSVFNEQVNFHFGVALREPQIAEIHPIGKALSDMTNFVDHIINQLGRLL